MRRAIATGLQLWFAANILGSLVLQRWIAERDDQLRFQRPRGM